MPEAKEYCDEVELKSYLDTKLEEGNYKEISVSEKEMTREKVLKR